MKVDTRRSGGVTILDLAGKLVYGVGNRAVRDAVQEAVAEQGNVLVNLAGVTAMDSSGLGELVSCRTHAWNHGRRVALLNPSPDVLRLLDRTRVVQVFQVYSDEAGAVRELE